MAKTFKSLLGDDKVNTRTLLHEAIPITGTISSGTYSQGTSNVDNNIKTFSHGMFESVYDYPYLSSSANHIFDITYGVSSPGSPAIEGYASASTNTQNAKKVNIYNQMAQTLFGYTASGSIRHFDSDGTLDDAAGIMHQCFFLNFSRLLVKDEIKKNSFRLGLHTSGTVTHAANQRMALQTLGDYKAANEFRTSPAGDYGLIFLHDASGVTSNTGSVGLIFYQAGIVVLTSSIFRGQCGTVENPFKSTGGHDGGTDHGTQVAQALTASTIQDIAKAFRHQIYDIDFNNTIELNSSIYFCRVNHNEYNYSSNPTFVDGSKLRVKNNVNDLPVTYITTVGLYSPDNELLAVAKLSEPIRKDPNTELTLRVRLDY